MSDHITSFGAPRLFAPHPPLFKPEPEDPADPSDTRMSRKDWERIRAAEVADRERGDLASKVASLEYDLRLARERAPQEGQVLVSAADAALIESYREFFPTPKEAKAAHERLVALEEKEELRSYDDARRDALAEFQDLPANFQKLIPTAEELLKRPGGKEQLKDLDFMRGQVEQFASAYGAERQNQDAQTDVGVSPGEVKSGGEKPASVDDARALAREVVQSRYQQKES